MSLQNDDDDREGTNINLFGEFIRDGVGSNLNGINIVITESSWLRKENTHICKKLMKPNDI